MRALSCRLVVVCSLLYAMAPPCFCLAADSAGDPGPAGKWRPGHYVYVGLNAGPLTEAHLYHPKFRGIQKPYAWNSIEVGDGVYDFSEMDADLDFLAGRGLTLAVQVQYKAFKRDTSAVPRDIIENAEEYGPNRTYLNTAGALYPSLWNPKVAARFHRFLRELGKRYDRHPNFGFINLPETATSPQRDAGDLAGVEYLKSLGYTPENYIDAIREDTRVLSEAFPNTVKVLYANWGPAGSLEAWAEFGKSVAVGIGGPDVHPGLVVPSYDVWKKMQGLVPLGAAVQFADYYEDKKARAELIDVARSFAFARDELKLNYLFWANSPREGFERVLRMFDSPDFPADEAGGLETALPACYRQ